MGTGASSQGPVTRMFSPRAALSMVWRAGLAGVMLALAAIPSAAAENDFCAQLSGEQLAASGLTSLTPAERTAIDRIVAAEMSESRLAEGVVLSGTFVSRRTPVELKETGLDRLTSEQVAKLNELVASSTIDRPKPKERPRLNTDSVINVRARPEVHGSLSLTYGRVAGGQSFHGADLWLDYSIPELNLNLGFGMSRNSGGALYDYYPGIYGPHYLGRDPFLFDATNPGILRDSLHYGTGETFQMANAWGSIGYSRLHY